MKKKKESALIKDVASKIHLIRGKRVMLDIEKKYDAQFKVVFNAIRELMTPSKQKLRKIGFQRGKSKEIRH